MHPRAWIRQIAFAPNRSPSQSFVVRGRALLFSLLAISFGEPPARGLTATAEASVAPLAPNPYLVRRPLSGAGVVPAQRRSDLRASAFRHNPRLVLAPSPYESVAALELAPSPYGATAPLAPDPYLEQEAVSPAGPSTPRLPEFSALSPRALGSSPRLALAPSPYGLSSVPDLAPNPY